MKGNFDLNLGGCSWAKLTSKDTIKKLEPELVCRNFFWKSIKNKTLLTSNRKLCVCHLGGLLLLVWINIEMISHSLITGKNFLAPQCAAAAEFELKVKYYQVEITAIAGPVVMF